MHMETFNNKMDYVSDFVAEIVDKVVSESKVLQEMNLNRVSVGLGRNVSVRSIYWQPHHLRLYFDFDKTFFNRQKPMFEVGCRYLNGTELEIPDFLEHRIVIKKFQIELTNKVEHKRWYVIKLDSTSRVQMFDVYVRKVNESLSVLKEFIKRFGGVSNFKLLNFRSQDKIANEDVIDRLPLKLAFNQVLTQKVYNESNIETSEPLAAINYVENAALRTVQPEIKERLDNISDSLSKFKDEALLPLTEQIKVHLEVQHETLKTLKSIQSHFSRVEVYPPNDSSFTQSGNLSHAGNVGLNNRSVSEDLVGEGLVTSFPLPTISKSDMETHSKAYRLMRARQLLREFGWGDSVW